MNWLLAGNRADGSNNMPRSLRHGRPQGVADDLASRGKRGAKVKSSSTSASITGPGPGVQTRRGVQRRQALDPARATVLSEIGARAA